MLLASPPRGKRTIPDLQLSSWEEGSSVPRVADAFVGFAKAVNDISRASLDGAHILLHCLVRHIFISVTYIVSIGPYPVYLTFNEQNSLGTSTVCFRFIVVRLPIHEK